MTVPRPLASHDPRLQPLQGDREFAEMSFASSLTEQELVDPGREVLVMNVDLGNGRKDKLVVHEQDNPEELAAEFCRKHGLNERLVRALALNIRGNLDQLADEQREEGSLLQDSKDHRALPKSFAHKQLRGNNVGERLYVQGKIMKGYMDFHLNRARQELQSSLQQELTFAPKLNPGKTRPRTVEEQSLQTQRLIAMKRREAIVKQAEECTFAPATCPR